MEFYGGSKEFQWVHGFSVEFQQSFHEVPCSVHAGCKEFPWSSIEVPWNSMKFP